ncbi:unnamed protein product, partial [Amoebophrya sp. A25]
EWEITLLERAQLGPTGSSSLGGDISTSDGVTTTTNSRSSNLLELLETDEEQARGDYFLHKALTRRELVEAYSPETKRYTIYAPIF